MSSRPDDVERFVEETAAAAAAPVVIDEAQPESMPERHAPGTAPANPLERAPNIRLRKTRPGSVERAIYEATYGEFYPPKARVRVGGAGEESAVVDLPALPDGKPDLVTQARGWFSDYAHRIIQSPTGRIHYRLIKGARA